MDTCETCVYYNEDDSQCRRYPPSIDRSRWQNVRPSDWCGEFQPVKAPAKKAAGGSA